MKTLIAAILFSCLGALNANAELASVIVPVNISSSTPTDIADATAGYRRLGVQNLNASQALYCGDSVSVSSIATNAACGTVIAPATSTTAPATPTWFTVAAGQSFYCLTGSVVGTGRAIVIRENVK